MLAQTRPAEQAAASRAMARFAASFDLTVHPPAVRDAARDALLDALGITLGGAREPAARIVAQLAAPVDGDAGASVIGHGFRTTAELAARANGCMAHILGYSDFSVRNVLHPSVGVWPAVWAVAEERGASGRDVLAAYVVGVEIACKLGAALTPEFSHRGWHPCAVLASFGAAAAAGRLFDLDAEGMGHALGIAGVQAAGIKVSLGSMTKALATGRAAENGVLAARLASAGFTGPADVLEGHDGFFQTFGAGLPCGGLAQALGDPLEILSPGITAKAYPSCTRSHPTLDALLGLVAEHAIGPDDVARVECHVTPGVLKVVRFARPGNAMQAKFSLPFCAAVALVDGRVEVGSFTDARLHDPRIRAMMERVETAAEPGPGGEDMPAHAPFAGRVVVHLRDGRILRASRDRGPWEGPVEARGEAARTRLREKFAAGAGVVLDPPAIARAVELIDRIDTLPDIRELMAVVRGDASASRAS